MLNPVVWPGSVCTSIMRLRTNHNPNSSTPKSRKCIGLLLLYSTWMICCQAQVQGLSHCHSKVMKSDFYGIWSFHVSADCFKCCEATWCSVLFAGVKPVTFSDWEKIDNVEVRRGKASGKPREKIRTVEEMLQVVRAWLLPCLINHLAKKQFKGGIRHHRSGNLRFCCPHVTKNWICQVTY